MTATELRPETTSANRPLPHLRSELSRITHRRLYRVLALVLVAGIVVVSAIVFGHSSNSTRISPAEQQQYEQALRQFDRQFDQTKAGWQDCASNVPEGSTVADFCGPEPDRARDAPKLAYFVGDRRYDATTGLPAVAISVSLAAAALAFLLGASAGGAEWSSRSMALQLLWEPRRLRLLTIKWLALVLVAVATAMAALLVGLGLGALTAALRGTPDRVDGRLDPGFVTELAGTTGRGLVLVAVAASFGYALSMLVRNTGAALGTAFVYFAVVENGIRIALLRFGSEPFMLSTNAVGFLIPGGIAVPGRLTQVSPPDGGDYTDAQMLDLTNGRALVTLLVYLLVLAIPAVWSFVRRDVA
jgi:ABC-type transport system involved in multi-copper enzyme maturation permease subunit